MSIEINREKLKRAVKAVKVGSAALFGLSALGGAIRSAEGSSNQDPALDEIDRRNTIVLENPEVSIPVHLEGVASNLEGVASNPNSPERQEQTESIRIFTLDEVSLSQEERLFLEEKKPVSLEGESEYALRFPVRLNQEGKLEGFIETSEDSELDNWMDSIVSVIRQIEESPGGPGSLELLLVVSEKEEVFVSPVLRTTRDVSLPNVNEFRQGSLITTTTDGQAHWLSPVDIPDSSVEVIRTTADYLESLNQEATFNGRRIEFPPPGSLLLVQTTEDGRTVALAAQELALLYIQPIALGVGSNIRENPTVNSERIGIIDQDGVELVQPEEFDPETMAPETLVSDIFAEGGIITTLDAEGKPWRLVWVDKEAGIVGWVRDDVAGIEQRVDPNSPATPQPPREAGAKVEESIETDGLDVIFGSQNGTIKTIIINGEEIEVDFLDIPTSETTGFGMRVFNWDNGDRDIWVNGVVVGWEENQFIELERSGVGRYQVEVRPLIIAIPMKVQRGGQAFLVRLIERVGDGYGFSSDGRSWTIITEEEFMARINPGDQVHTRIPAFFILLGAANPDCDEACLQRGDIIRKYNFAEADRMFNLYTSNQNTEEILTVGLAGQYAADSA